MSRMRVSVAVLLLAGFVSGAAGPSAAPQQDGAASQGEGRAAGAATAGAEGQQPTFRGSIDLVRVDVAVTRDGKPVMDLAAADFEVFEDGKPREVEQFRVVRIDGSSPPIDPPTTSGVIRSVIDEEREAQREDARLFVFFLDDYHTRDRNAIVVREPLIRFIETQLLPSDLLAIMYPLTPVNDVIFTRDHEAVVDAISRFEGRKYKYEARNVFERRYEREPTEVVERIRNAVVMDALEGLSIRLGGLRDGRKSAIFVSEGFPLILPAAMRRSDAMGRQPFDSGANVNQEAEDRARLAAEMDIQSRMRDVYRAANRNNTSFYSLDPRGLAVFEFDIDDGGRGGSITPGNDQEFLRDTQETLRNLSLETDGRAIINRNTLLEGLTEMVRDSSYYYLIGYTSQAPADGKFHDIRVRVKRSGVDVRARKGFWALSPEMIERLSAPPAPEIARPVQAALAGISSSMQAARFVRTWVGTERGAGGKTRVTLVWEPLPAQAGVRREQAGGLSVLAVDAQGALVYRGRSPEGRDGAPAAGGRLGAQRMVFEAAPGEIEMRLSVEGEAGGTLDMETRRLDVPDLTAAGVVLSTPRVFRTRNAREFQVAAADAAAVPAAAREFSRVERLLIRFDAYGQGGEDPKPSAALLGRTGQKIADVPLAAAKAGGTHQIDLPLNTMAAGEYLIEITVTGATGETAQELVAFRVGA